MRVILFISILLLTGTAYALTPQEIGNQQAKSNVDMLMIEYKQNLLMQSFLWSQNNSIQAEVNLLSKSLQASGVNWPGQDLSKSTAPVDWTKY